MSCSLLVIWPMISGRILAGRGLHYASPARNGNTIIISDRFGKHSTAARSSEDERRWRPGAGGGPRQGRHECHLKIVKVFLETHTICAVPQGRRAVAAVVESVVEVRLAAALATAAAKTK